jgi:hypothetical protein
MFNRLTRCTICFQMMRGEEQLEECSVCGRRCCEDCLHIDYQRFNYYDGDVETVVVCRDCRAWKLLLVAYLQAGE